MTLKLKRAYDAVAKNDGFRILVDGLWPRGVTKASAKIDVWAKDVAPSKELRAWFHVDKEKRFKDFSKKYKAELSYGKSIKNLKNLIKDKKVVTLVTAVKDIELSHIPVLRDRLDYLTY